MELNQIKRGFTLPLIGRARAHTQIIFWIHRRKIGRELHLLHLLLSLSCCLLGKKRKEREQKEEKALTLLVFRIGGCKGEHTICLQSPHDGQRKGYVYLWRHPPSQCRQITEKGGRQRLKARTINFPGESVHSGLEGQSDLSLTRLRRRRQAWWTNEILEYSGERERMEQNTDSWGQIYSCAAGETCLRWVRIRRFGWFSSFSHQLRFYDLVDFRSSGLIVKINSEKSHRNAFRNSINVDSVMMNWEERAHFWKSRQETKEPWTL